MYTSADFQKLRDKISDILAKNAQISPASVKTMLPVKDLLGKIYESHVLATVIENLVSRERCIIKLINSGLYRLKQKGSSINKSYPYFEVYKGDVLIGEIFTDTEFTSLSSQQITRSTSDNSDYHELDIVMFRPGCSNRPAYSDVLLAIECKATTFQKSTFRQILGFRRELGLLAESSYTAFSNWPIPKVNSNPPSVHMCYSTDQKIERYKDNAFVYGILMVHEKM
ncbi:hypothetical protein I6I97_02090 [Sphingobacterium multivorum]|uniref:hypothetical protein n=1 Tax=Sphingobacterium multivorum TaxID=28454 RepID=UPI0019197E1E|nr:hypothetical protein [Sphingobacterium multivorum]QQT62632.1 hypothetical protein I6I97_02090 [Sphingobacterium multivorum]